MSQPITSRWLHRFAVLTAVATLGLIVIGGLVTSHGVGLAVPDWPNSYGYNMFAFPISKWVGGILYEHSHRLIATFVGLLTTVLAVWLWVRETSARERWLGVGAIALVFALLGARLMPVYLALATLAPIVVGFGFYQIVRHPGTLRWWGIIALAAVVLQGVLGGLRVVWLKDQIGIFHAMLAQLFFALLCAISFFTSRWATACNWGRTRSARAGSSTARPIEQTQGDAWDQKRSDRFRWLLTGTTLLILAQLLIGATMRHEHAGLAIRDFPLAYGKLWPAMDAESVARYNQQRMETVSLNPITAFQIGLQMTHRLVALMICAAVAICTWLAWTRLGAQNPVTKLTLIWLGLILSQGLLGATILWSNKAADIATAHVLVGALVLALGTMLSIISSHGLVWTQDSEAAEELKPHPFGAQPCGTAAQSIR